MATYSKVEEAGNGVWQPMLKVKGEGRVDLGSYSSARLAAVAYDVARLIFIREKRPETDLRADKGLMHPVDGYLIDPVFKELLSANTSFEEICSLLRSGALADQFLTAQDRTTRNTSSSNSGELSILSRQPSRLAQQGAPAAAPQQPAPPQQQPPAQQSPAQQQQTPSPFQSFPLPAAAPDGDAGSPGSPTSASKRRPSKWLEWPPKSGQFATQISDKAAVKGSMAVPVKVKKELFQAKGAECEVQAHDMAQGSAKRWNWELRDHVGGTKTTVHLGGLQPFFNHYKAAAGDVLVAVASAPGAVKATMFKADSQDAAKFKAFIGRQAAKQAGGNGSGVTKKRPAEASAPRQQTAKAPKAAAGASAPGAAAAEAAAGAAAGVEAIAAALGQHCQPPASPRAAAAAAAPVTAAGVAAMANAAVQQRQASTSPGTSRQPSLKSSSMPQQHLHRQPSVKPPQEGGVAAPPPPIKLQQQQQKGGAAAHLLALADTGIDPSHPSCQDTLAASPTAQVAQSPFRHQPLAQRSSFAAVPGPTIKQEQASPPLQPPVPAPAAAGGAGDGGGAAAPAPTHSPARMSCADAPPAHAQQRGDRQALAAPPAMDAAAGGEGGAALDPYQMYRSMKPAVVSCGLPAEQRHAFWQSYNMMRPAAQRIVHDEVADMQAESPNWREELRNFVLRQLSLEKLLPGSGGGGMAAAPSDMSGGRALSGVRGG